MPLKEESIPYSFQEEGGCHAMQGHMKKHQGWLGDRKKAWAKAFIVVFMGKNGRGKVSSSELVSLSNFRWLLAMVQSLVVWYLVLG